MNPFKTDFFKEINLNTLSVIVTTNSILVVVLTLIFSSWRVYSTSMWLQEVKNHIDVDMKTIIINQERVKSDLVIYNKKILNVKTDMKGELDIHVARVIRNHAIIMKNQETMTNLLKEINVK